MAKKLRVDATKVCGHCGRPIETCTIGGLHGMIRERAAKACQELKDSGEYR